MTPEEFEQHFRNDKPTPPPARLVREGLTMGATLLVIAGVGLLLVLLYVLTTDLVYYVKHLN